MSAAPALAPLRCAHCGAAVPLVAAAQFPCPYCAAVVHVPPLYRELFEVQAREAGARHRLETELASVTAPPPAWIDLAAVALVLVLPALVAIGWERLASARPSLIAVFAFGIVPGLWPGTAVWVWSAAVHATIVRFRSALAADPPATAGGAELCRQCGAPLARAADGLFAHCAYCGTDSLVGDPSATTRRVATALRAEVRTLAQAVVALRARRRLLVGGALLTAVAFAAVVVALLAAAARLHA